MVLSQSAFFFIILGITALIGFVRGWGREVVTCAVILGAVLLLISGGEQMLGQFIFITVPKTLHLPGAGSTTPHAIAARAQQTHLLSLVALSLLASVGYVLGHRHGTPPKTHAHHLSGVIPGTVNGAALAYYAGHGALPGMLFALHSPSDTLGRSYLLGIIGVGVVALLFILMRTAVAARARS